MTRLTSVKLSLIGVLSIFFFTSFSKSSNNASIHQSHADTTHFIGEKFGGGIVFYVDETGKHGLIAASTDQSQGIPWWNGGNKLTNATSDGHGAGLANIDKIIALHTSGTNITSFAAKICADYSITVKGTTYDDWYLPSKKEMSLLVQQKDKVGGFDRDYYWTSNESDIDRAWVCNFYDGMQLMVDKSDANAVRAIRTF
jgi:hypothetical protein